MANTTHLALPLLAAAQAQKHVTHNDALQRLDALVQLSVKDRHLTSPPGSPGDGDRYLVASGASGDWASWDLNIAWYVDGVWTKLVPRGGWIAYVEDETLVLIHDGTGWVKVPATAETWQVLAASAVAASHSGNTAETTLATATVPGGAMGPNGVLRITVVWENAGSNNVTVRTRFGGLSYGSAGVPAGNRWRSQFQIHNRNAANSQAAYAGGTGGWHNSAPAMIETSLDTTAATQITLTAQLANSADTVTIQNYLVELLYQA